MSFHFRRHAPIRKGAAFTHKIETKPKTLFGQKLEVPQCSFCSMKSITTCELPTCRKGLCAKHVTRKAGGSLCPDHKGALLVQYDGFPTEQFGDRGEAYAKVTR